MSILAAVLIIGVSCQGDASPKPQITSIAKTKTLNILLKIVSKNVEVEAL